MFNEDGSHTDYYKTAKRVYQYMIKQKDEHNIEWPILGICQGFEVIHYLTNDDKQTHFQKWKSTESRCHSSGKSTSQSPPVFSKTSQNRC